MIKSAFYPAITLVLFFLILFAYTKVAGPIPFSVNSVTTTKSDTFQVSGEGTSTVAPDIALVTAGISANAATVKDAQDQINNTINKVSAAIKSQGVESKDIQTSGYNINPNYDFQSGRQRITGYQARTSLKIKVRNIDKVNSIIDAATTSGANEVGNIIFDIDDKTKAENEARQKAVEEAKRKANQAASIAGFKLGRIINYSENFNGVPGPIPLRAEMKALDSASGSTQIEPGSSEVKVNVILSYELQ